MGGHICVDTAQGGFAAALPFLIMYGGYSYSEVTFLILASNLASAVIQPLFGWLGDCAARPWFMAAGVFLAGAGMTGVGLMHEYPLIATCFVALTVCIAVFGVAVCVGGVVSPMLGMAGDALGLPIVMMILAGFFAAGILLSAVVVRIVR